MFDSIKRKLGINPPREWECGDSRGVDLIGTLDNGTCSTVSHYRNGQKIWSRDVETELHQFTCDCLEQLLNHQPDRIELPVYYDRLTESLNPWATALQLAERHSDSGHSSLHPAFYDVPQSFRTALELKRTWLRGESTKEDIKAMTVQIVDETKYIWPSSFCLRINALQMTCWCVRSAMNLDSPWLSAAGCAQTASSAIAMLAACETIDCTSFKHDELVWEGASINGESFGRGVGCPQAVDERVERSASQIIDQTKQQWMARLTRELETSFTPNTA